MKRILTIAIATTALLGLGACSSDSPSASPGTGGAGGATLPDSTIPDISLPDISIPDIALPGNLTEECQAVSMQFAGIFAQAFAPEADQSQFEQVFGDVEKSVPDELRDDVQVLAAAFSKYAQILKDSGNNMASPDVAQALENLGTPEVQAASDNLQTYFDATCPQG